MAPLNASPSAAARSPVHSRDAMTCVSTPFTNLLTKKPFTPVFSNFLFLADPRGGTTARAVPGVAMRRSVVFDHARARRAGAGGGGKRAA